MRIQARTRWGSTPGGDIVSDLFHDGGGMSADQAMHRAGPVRAGYDSVADLAEALRRAEAAHGRYEQEIGKADPDWPQWYAQFMVDEQAGQEPTD